MRAQAKIYADQLSSQLVFRGQALATHHDLEAAGDQAPRAGRARPEPDQTPPGRRRPASSPTGACTAPARRLRHDGDRPRNAGRSARSSPSCSTIPRPSRPSPRLDGDLALTQSPHCVRILRTPFTRRPLQEPSAGAWAKAPRVPRHAVTRPTPHPLGGGHPGSQGQEPGPPSGYATRSENRGLRRPTNFLRRVPRPAIHSFAVVGRSLASPAVSRPSTWRGQSSWTTRES